MPQFYSFSLYIEAVQQFKIRRKRNAYSALNQKRRKKISIKINCGTASEDFKKRSINEMEEYILQGGLEQIDKYHPIKLIKVGDQYCVGSNGHHRVLLAEHMQVKTIPAHVKELKILK